MADSRQTTRLLLLENWEELSEIILKQEIKNIGKGGENVRNNCKLGNEASFKHSNIQTHPITRRQ